MAKDEAKIQLTLPYPPSINHYYGRGRNGRLFIKKQGIGYRWHVAFAVMKLGSCPIAGQLKMRLDIYPPDKRKRDVDNVQKACIDAMEIGGLYCNDNQIKDLHSIMHEPVKGGKVVVALEEIRKAGKGKK